MSNNPDTDWKDIQTIRNEIKKTLLKHSLTGSYTVGPVGSGADFITDGINDHIEIQAALDASGKDFDAIINDFVDLYSSLPSSLADQRNKEPSIEELEKICHTLYSECEASYAEHTHVKLRDLFKAQAEQHRKELEEFREAWRLKDDYAIDLFNQFNIERKRADESERQLKSITYKVGEYEKALTYKAMLQEAAKVYAHVTNGRLTGYAQIADTVIEYADEEREKILLKQKEDLKETHRKELDEAVTKGRSRTLEDLIKWFDTHGKYSWIVNILNDMKSGYLKYSPTGDKEDKC
jgi:hypothetical protein